MTETATALGAIEAAQEFFTRFGAGDRAALLELFADEVDWDVPGSADVPWTGRRTTKAQIDAFFATAAEELAATEEFIVEEVLGDTRNAVALGRFTHVISSTGKRFSSRFALHIAVLDGEIRRYHMFEDSHAAAEAFTGAA
jgi:ketosteroid isomerase-like protein